jgi:hypothetical protein
MSLNSEGTCAVSRMEAIVSSYEKKYERWARAVEQFIF